jgi:hypothetical protein
MRRAARVATHVVWAGRIEATLVNDRRWLVIQTGLYRVAHNRHGDPDRLRHDANARG